LTQAVCVPGRLQRPELEEEIVSKQRLAVIACVAILIVPALVAAFAWPRKPPANPAVDEGRAVAEAFLSRLRTDKPSAVWESTTAEFKSAEGRTKFVARVQKHPWLREQAAFETAREVRVNDAERLEFVFTAPKSGKPIRLLLGSERGSWKVDRLEF